MKKHLLPIMLLLSAFVISGCGDAEPLPSSSIEPSSSSSEISTPTSASEDSSSVTASSSLPPESTYLKKDIVVQLDSGLRAADNQTTYDLTFNYDDELFLKDAKQYDENLSTLSLGATLATASKTSGDAFYTDLGFKDIVAHDYDKTPTKDTMGYYLAHKTIDEFELVTVAFRGFEYGMEWANNFVIGKTGNHEGFNARGLEAYQELQDYIAANAGGKTLKLWINGYSRAGALSNVLSSLILKGDKVSVVKENMFVYTFEAPASLTEENAVTYENVHNITNDADMFTYIPPVEYGLKRCGVDYQIYDLNVTTLMKEFDPEIVFPEFEEPTDLGEGLTSDPLVREYLLNTIFNKEEYDGSDPTIFANTREQFVDNYQEGLSSGIGYIFALTGATRSALLADLQALSMWEAFSLVSDTTGEEMMKFLKTYLDRDGVVYDAEKIQSDCAILIKGIQNLFLSVLLAYLAEGPTKNDLTRIINMHYPETTYVLLINAHNKEQAQQ